MVLTMFNTNNIISNIAWWLLILFNFNFYGIYGEHMVNIWWTHLINPKQSKHLSLELDSIQLKWLQ